MTSMSSQWWLRPGESLELSRETLRRWGVRQVLVAAASGVVVGVFIGVATVLIPNPVFARDIAPVWWNYPVWLVTSAMTGMLIATYVREADGARAASDDPAEDSAGTLPAEAAGEARRDSRLGVAGAALAWFAVGCPVCNKIALLALGYSGAITWFAPLQPFLAGASLLLVGVALVGRLRGQTACPVRTTKVLV